MTYWSAALEREQRFWQLGFWFLVQAIPAQGVYKQAHHNFFLPAFLKEGRRLLQPPSSSWPSSPFFKHHGALSHSTLQDDDLAFQEDQVWALTCLMFDKSSIGPLWFPIAFFAKNINKFFPLVLEAWK